MTDLLRLSVPLTLWLVLFSLVYGLHGLACTMDLAPGTGRSLLVAVWLGGVAAQVALLLALRSPRFAATAPTIRRSSIALAATALVATIWSMFPVSILPLC